MTIEDFRATVLAGRANGNFVMKGFAHAPNVAPFVDEIYAYLSARTNGEVHRRCGGNPDIAHIADAIARRDVEARAERNCEVGEVPANARTARRRLVPPCDRTSVSQYRLPSSARASEMLSTNLYHKEERLAWKKVDGALGQEQAHLTASRLTSRHFE
jgi:hypothetical protein